MAARPGGYASKAEQARRLEVIRELWPTDLSCVLIGERLGVHEATVSDLARQAGLPPRRRDVRTYNLRRRVESVVSP